MKKWIKYIALALVFTLVISCKYYNFTGGSVGAAKTFQVNFFRNEAPIVEPGLDREFTLALQDLILNQTNLSLMDSNADLVYEGEITEFQIAPMTATATAKQTAAQNRLTIAVNVRFTNNTEEDKDFEKRFSFYYDYPATTQLQSVKTTAFEEIFERLTQDIFNASLADW